MQRDPEPSEASYAKPSGELQQCMALLMTINGDDVMEASLLWPVEEGSGPPPTLEEETTLLDKGNGLSGAPDTATLQSGR